MLEIIQRIVYDVTGITGLTPDTDFVRDLGLSSFDVVTIANAFEEEYHVSIAVRDLWQLRTVRDVIDYMNQKQFHA